MANEGSQGGMAGKGKPEQVVKPGTTSGEIGGIKNVEHRTPDAGDKPSRNDPASRQHEPGVPLDEQRER